MLTIAGGAEILLIAACCFAQVFVYWPTLTTLLQQVEADLSAAIPLLADTGPLTVQLSCLARQALPAVDLCLIECRFSGLMIDQC
jgi:hypothetical protein